MKKINWPSVIALVFIIAAIAIYLRSMSKPPKEKHTPDRKNITVQNNPAKDEIKVNGRVVIGKVTEEQKKNPQIINPPNTPSPNWEKDLTKSLANLGGEEVKNIAVKKIASVIWMKNEGGMNAESVIITLTNKDGAESTFRAMIDSATGRILQTWDRTIFEPAGRRDRHELTLDVDPSYFTETP